MANTLTEMERERLIEQASKSSETISSIHDRLKKTYSAGAQPIQSAQKVVQSLARLRRDLIRMDLGAEKRKALPKLWRGGKLVDPYDL